MSNTARPKRKAKIEGPTLTRAISHIRLAEANRGKLEALDALWLVYKPLCERYIDYFCTKTAPDKDADFVFESVMSARWQRVAVQQAAGVAKSWRSNWANQRADYEQRLADYEGLSVVSRISRKRPVWGRNRICRNCTQCASRRQRTWSNNCRTMRQRSS